MPSLIGAANKLSKGRLESLALQYYEDIQLSTLHIQYGFKAGPDALLGY